MKNRTKVILGFISGAAVGTGITTLAMRAFYTKFINETLTAEVNKQMDDIKAEYDKAVNDILEKYQGKECENEPAEEEKDESVEKPKVQKPVKKSKEQKKEEAVDYTKYSEDKKKEDPRTQAIIDIQQDKTNAVGSYIIEFDDYTEENGYEKLTTTYYTEDDIYTNDYDDPDPNIVKIVGGLTTEEMHEKYGYGDSMYVRNDDKQVDYEIIISNEPYEMS